MSRECDKYRNRNITRCRLEAKRRRKLEKRAGICQRCHKRKAFTKTRCRTCRARELEVRKRHYQKTKDEAFQAYGGYRCACPKCPLPEPGKEFMTLDHIKGDGHKIEMKRRVWIYQYLKKLGYPSGIQPMCYNCNCAKRSRLQCPHMDK